MKISFWRSCENEDREVISNSLGNGIKSSWEVSKRNRMSTRNSKMSRIYSRSFHFAFLTLSSSPWHDPGLCVVPTIDYEIENKFWLSLSNRIHLDYFTLRSPFSMIRFTKVRISFSIHSWWCVLRSLLVQSQTLQSWVKELGIYKLSSTIWSKFVYRTRKVSYSRSPATDLSTHRLALL